MILDTLHVAPCSLSMGPFEMTCFKECDDENVDDFDGCTSGCKVETGYYCSGEPSVCATRCLLAAP